MGRSLGEMGHYYGVAHTSLWKRVIAESKKLSHHRRWRDRFGFRNGRCYIYAPWHPRATHLGYVLRSHIVWECYHGPISPKHIIHHINEDPGDDQIWNLDAITPSDHTAIHKLGGSGRLYKQRGQNSQWSWTFQYYDRGRHFTESTGTTDKVVAQRLLDERLKKYV
jgi:hypothetical protein